MAFSEFGVTIDRLRREPSACLYCANAAITKEHPLPVAMGGRLWSLLLCESHRKMLNDSTDERGIENFKSLTMFLGVKRQDGKEGTEFKAKTDEGETLTVYPDGSVPGRNLNVTERTGDNRIKKATGRLVVLDSLQKDGAFAQSGTNYLLAYCEKAPEVNFEVVADESIAGFILKIALHFVAGFVTDVKAEVANAILPSILGAQPATSVYVSTPSCNERLFPDRWPPTHEITVHPTKDNTIVTVLLYNSYAYLVRLPFSVRIQQPLRYVQPLLGRPDPHLFEIKAVKPIEWEYKAIPSDVMQWSAWVHKRTDRIEGYCDVSPGN